MKTNWMFALFLCAVAVCLVAPVASAANRTVTVSLSITDNRYDCASAADTGERRACNPGNLVSLVGARVELWERDNGGGANDDYIGTWVLAHAGVNALTFAWEGAAYQEGEANPVVYPVLLNHVRNTNGSGPVVKGIQDNGTEYPAWTWRISDTDTTYVANGCTTSGTNCAIYPSGTLVPTFSTTDPNSVVLMALDSAQRAVQVFSGIMGSGDVTMEFPRSDAGCNSGCALNRTAFGVPANRGNDGDLVPHEIGHILQMREFGQDWLRDDLNGDSWSIDTVEYQNGATTEGFASYVAAASLWNPGTTNANPRFSGFDVEQANGVPWNNAQCIGNIAIPGQVARAFWDLDDATNEAGAGQAAGNDDVSNYSSTTLVGYWDAFLSGTANRRDEETGNDGVNMRDFRANSGVNTETAIDHNCLGGQADD